MDNAIDDEGDGVMNDDDNDNGDGATDKNIDKDGDGDGATVQRTTMATAMV